MKRNETGLLSWRNNLRKLPSGVARAVVLAIAVSLVGPARSALAVTPSCFYQPDNGSYSFGLVGSNVVTTTDVPTSSFTGVFTTKASSSFFAVSAGSCLLNDDGSICTGTFTGTGVCAASNVTSGTMSLTLAGLDDVTPGGCNTLDSVGGALTLYYGSFNLQAGLFLVDIDTNTYSVAGEAQHQ